MQPTVSINLCCYNGERYLREALESVANQTYHDWELVIINDGSTDSTESIVKDYIQQGFPIVYYYQVNHGLGYSRNEALKRSSGKYIAFIDQDDVWITEKLEQQLAIFEKCTDVDFVYTNYYVTREKRRVIKFKGKQPDGYVFESFLFNYPVHISTAMVRSKTFDKLNSLFNPDLHLTEEYDVFMRALYNCKAAYISEPLATYRYHPNMTSATREISLIQETISVFESFKLLGADFEKKYAEIIKRINNNHKFALSFKLAKDELVQGNPSTACNFIRPYKFLNMKTFIFFMLTCLPSNMASWLWSSFLRIKSILNL